MTQDLTRCKETIEDTHKAVILLNSLPPQFDIVKDVIQYGRDEITTTKIIDAIVQKNESLKVFKTKGANRNDHKSESKNEVMMFKGKPKQKFKKKHHGTPAAKPNSDGNEKAGPRPLSQVKCFYCGKNGHYANTCTKKQHDKDQNNGQNAKQNGFSNVCEHGNHYKNELLVVSSTNDADSWILDSGCTMHACPSKSLFDSLKLIDGGEVILGDHTTLKIKGIGSVPLVMFDGVTRIIQNVRWVPNLRRNLLSESVFDDQHLKINTSNGIKEVIKNDKTVIKAIKKGGLYFVETSHELNAVNHQADKDLTEIKQWHARLGHIGNKGLNNLAKSGILTFSPAELTFCETCILSKKTAHPFPKSSYKAVKPLECVHADLWGPSQVPTIGGRYYFLSLIDQFSRRVWVYLLKHKNEAFDHFKHWKAMVENQTGLKLIALKTDNGLEFCNNEFNLFCKEHGIKRLLTVPGTPQQNGTAERMNRTLLEKARCLLLSSGMKNSMWGEAVITACYLINRSASSAIDFKTPFEMWFGRKPSLSHLRPFGCTAYAHASQGKLQPRALMCVMLGYPEGTKGYKLLLIQSNGYKVIVSRSVTFNESDFHFKSRLTPQVEQVSGSNNEYAEDFVPRTYIADPPDGADDQEEFDQGMLQDINPDDQGQHPHQLGGGEVTNPDHDQPLNSENIGNSGTVIAETVIDHVVDDLPPDIAVDAEHVENDHPLANYSLTRDREPRIRMANKRYADYTTNVLEYAFLVSEMIKHEISVPETFEEAVNCRHATEWINAMHDEIKSMNDNKTWKLIPLPKNARAIACKWIFRLKDGNSPVEPPRFKARLVAKGFSQKEGIDYNEIFAPVVKYKTLRLLLAMSTVFNWEIDQMDSPRQWNRKFDACMTDLGFSKSKYDSCLYLKNMNAKYPAFVLLYVDDMLIISDSRLVVNSIKSDIKKHFDMKDMGEAQRILGVKITRDRNKRVMYLSQTDYLDKVLDKFQLKNAKPSLVPLGGHLELTKHDCPVSDEDKLKMSKVPYDVDVGSVMYAMLCTRPDLAFGVSVLSRFMSNPGDKHWIAMKYLLKYISGTRKLGLIYGSHAPKTELYGYVDSDYASNKDNRKSTTGFFFTWAGNCISWKSQLQPIVALSSTEAEYIAATEASKEAIWLKGILQEIDRNTYMPIIYMDFQSALCLCKDPVYHERSKHIDVRYHFIRDMIESKEFEIRKILGEKNPADFRTKIVTTNKFQFCRDALFIGNVT
ncbi:unnamed protein product [Rhodiola kirilowii]